MILIERQQELEAAYGKKQAIAKIKAFIKEDEELNTIIEDYGARYEVWLDKTFSWDKKNIRLSDWKNYLIEEGITGEDLVLDVITSITYLGKTSIQAVAGMQLLGNSEDVWDNITTTGELLCLMQDCPLIEIEDPKVSVDGYRYVESMLILPEDIEEALERVAYLPPVLHTVEVTSNDDAGWLCNKKSIFLNKNHHDGQAPLHFLNIINNVEMTVDRNMLQYNEIGATPNHVKSTIRATRSMLRMGNCFKFIYRFDARYRSYASGYQLSPQGNDFRKSLLNLYKREVLTNDYNL